MPPSMSNSEEERKRRLAQALRDNLRRRKAQGRAAQDGDRPEAEEPREDEVRH